MTKKKDSPELAQLRGQIDSVDSEILKLLSKRGQCALEIGRIKKKTGAEIHVPSRERAIYDRLAKINRGPYKDESLFSIYREVISATHSLEAPLKVSYLGPQATFTQMAAIRHFGSSSDMVPEQGIQAIFDSVERGHSDYGVVPIENSTEGVVSHTLDQFPQSNLKVCAEVILKISHHLLSLESSLKDIKKVYSHPQALAQCRGWLSKHLAHATLHETHSTAEAALRASKEKGVAGISSEIASNVYKLPILKKEIQDQAQNYTRFLVIGNHLAEKTGNDKTSILFVIRDEAGGLHKTLSPFAKAKINLTKIESRPLKKKVWEYMFFVDLDGHVSDPRVDKALAEVKKHCSQFQVLGSYAKFKV